MIMGRQVIIFESRICILMKFLSVSNFKEIYEQGSLDEIK